MKNYRFSDGISVVKICGYYLIVSTTATWNDVSKIQMVSKTGILGLAMFLDGMEENKIIYYLSKLNRQPEERIKAYFESMISGLIAQGFLVEGV